MASVCFSKSIRLGARVCRCVLLLSALVLAHSQAQAEGFTRASAGYTWSFPADHGRHERYETEWWYYTGQLYEGDAAPFRDKPLYGFQLTFFRKGIRENGTLRNEFMAHAAVTDIAQGKTVFSSRIGGGALGLAGVSTGSLRAWSGDWSVDHIGNQLVLRFSVRDAQASKDRNVSILIKEIPAPWLHGAQGLSAKGRCEGCASMYYSLPELQLAARMAENEQERELHGIGWMDHEFMTQSLSSSQVGWDWMGLMLKDGRSVMLFRLRDKAGKTDFASGSVRAQAGGRSLAPGDFSLTPLATWDSKQSGGRYPIEWRLTIPSEAIDVVVRARVNESELGGEQKSESKDTVRYWEGPVASSDESVLGYLEMTGYAGNVTL
jgi:predicted secreted hydrolase